mmetsp:Transcript_42210/g.99063  ORF Transcript_42210/g.99063 Transcript_42210/m.99063 type:complete len:500 (+) Transcript_42210:126-1625(+)
MPPKKKQASPPLGTSVAQTVPQAAEGSDQAPQDDEAPQTSSASAAPAPPVPHALDDYVTVVVTPKLNFQLLRRPEWQAVSDISQEELRRGFLSRFPPALWMSSQKFSFLPALPASAEITQETKMLFYKLVSDEVSDEKIMLTILRELEKSYEAIIKRAVSESRSEALQDQLEIQEQAEEARKENAKQIGVLKKDSKSLRDQLQSMQKRLFLVEQEKDQLLREQHHLKEYVQKLERSSSEQVREVKAEQEDLRVQLQILMQERQQRQLQEEIEQEKRAKEEAAQQQALIESHQVKQEDLPDDDVREAVTLTSKVASEKRATSSKKEQVSESASTAAVPTQTPPQQKPRKGGKLLKSWADEYEDSLQQELKEQASGLEDDDDVAAEVLEQRRPPAKEVHTSAAAAQRHQSEQADLQAADAAPRGRPQTDHQEQKRTEASTQTEDHAASESTAVAGVTRRVDQLQTQFAALQSWLLQGSHLLAAAGALSTSEGATAPNAQKP